MLIRAIAISLALLVGMGTIIPLTGEIEAAKPNYKKKYKKLKKYSKAWWRWYHKQQRKKRAILARKRALRAKQILLARQRTTITNQTRSKVEKTAPAQTVSPIKETSKNEPKLPVNDPNGKSVGMVSLTLFGFAAKTDSEEGLTKRIGGVPTSSLRRDVVGKVVKEQGWVVNDYHKNLNGKKVYVVVAQCPAKGGVQSRLFYFTEVEGKIYSVSSTCSNDSQERIQQESEKMIQSLQAGTVTNLIGLK